MNINHPKVQGHKMSVNLQGFPFRGYNWEIIKKDIYSETII